jgi:hypothetical protein
MPDASPPFRPTRSAIKTGSEVRIGGSVVAGGRRQTSMVGTADPPRTVTGAEVDAGLDPRDFTMRNAVARMGKLGADPVRGVLEGRLDLGGGVGEVGRESRRGTWWITGPAKRQGRLSQARSAEDSDCPLRPQSFGRSASESRVRSRSTNESNAGAMSTDTPVCLSNSRNVFRTYFAAR